MVGRASIKKENPYIGSYTVQYRLRSGKLKKTIAYASHFRLVLGRYRYTKWIPFPEGVKGKEKKALVYAHLINFRRAEERKQEKRKQARRARAAQQGRVYRPKKIEKLSEQEITGLSDRELKQYKEKFRETFRGVGLPAKEEEDFMRVVTQRTFEKRVQKLEESVSEEIKQAPFSRSRGKRYSSDTYLFSPQTIGKITTRGRSRGSQVNWWDGQRSEGFDKEGSIIYQVTRVIRSLFKSRFFEKIAAAYEYDEELNMQVGIGLVTNLLHKTTPDISDSYEPEQYVLVTVDKKGRIPKKDKAVIEWSFVRAFMKTYYHSKLDLFERGRDTSEGLFALTSSGVGIQRFKAAFKVFIKDIF